jgi:hypothetical protein
VEGDGDGGAASRLLYPGPDRDSTPDPNYVMAVLIDDKEGTIFEHRGYPLD